MLKQNAVRSKNAKLKARKFSALQKREIKNSRQSLSPTPLSSLSPTHYLSLNGLLQHSTTHLLTCGCAMGPHTKLKR